MRGMEAGDAREVRNLDNVWVVLQGHNSLKERSAGHVKKPVVALNYALSVSRSLCFASKIILTYKKMKAAS